MNIGIDESGTFVYTGSQNSWNCVVAYAYPESHSRRIRSLVQDLVVRNAADRNREVKLRDLDEDSYIAFLRGLRKFDGVFYSVATDASANTPDVLTLHQDAQTCKVLEPIDQMIHESGREGLRLLAKRVEELPHQLYVQMICQVQLVLMILRSAVLFFVQRYPQTLGRFRWRIDQKNSKKTEYETAYSQVLPAFLQSASVREPLGLLEEADYSSFERLHFPRGEEPTYLRDTYGIEVEGALERKLNIGQFVGEDTRFVDSRDDAGVRIADLLASGMRRCLRGRFTNNVQIAASLGALMVQREHRGSAVKLISLGKKQQEIHEDIRPILVTMRANARGMLVR